MNRPRPASRVFSISPKDGIGPRRMRKLHSLNRKSIFETSMSRKNFLFVFTVVAFLSTATWAQVPNKEKVVAGAARAFEKVTKAYVGPAPGCAAAVSLNGDVVFEKAFGLADLEHNVPNTAQTIFESGSVAKQFTATALVLLQQDGKLSLDDPVRKYIPELPDYGSPLTIRHLLNHTSGLRDWGTVMSLTGAAEANESSPRISHLT